MPASDKNHPFDPAAFLQVVGCLTEGRDKEGNIIPGLNGDEVADASEFLTALFDLLMMEEIRKSRSGDQTSTKVGELLGGTMVQVVCTSFILVMATRNVLTSFAAKMCELSPNLGE